MSEAEQSADQKPSRSAASRQRRSARAIAAERQRKQTMTKAIGIAVAVAILVAIVAVVLYQRQQSATVLPGGVASYEIPGAQHSTDPVTYAQNPPAGGVHDPTWQNCGFYAAPVRNENAVHSLEHGTVWITYQPDLAQDQIDILRNLAESQSYILVSPMAGIPSPVVASAWGRQLQLESADDPRLDQFVRSFRLGTNAPEPGAACSGGTSVTT